MHAGYLILGDPFPDGPHFEIINTQRAWHYATSAGISWLNDCGLCPAIDGVVEGTPYTDPANDHAPWYDPNNPDTADFFGVIGLDIIGAESSTRTATVLQAFTGGGVIAPAYFGPRTMVVRGIAVAMDECALATGIDWLNAQYGQSVEECGGDVLTYFDCCPCMCLNEQGDPACWPENYGGLRDGPNCEHDWWPVTYQELLDGPPPTSLTLCSWPRIYRQMRDGPPAWSCCVDSCVAPYYRQLQKARITAGPTMIDRRALSSCGAMAVFEFTIVAADPTEYTPLGEALTYASTGDGGPYTTPSASTTPVNPFDAYRTTSTRTAVLQRPSPLAESTWNREQVVYEDTSPVRLSDDTAHYLRFSSMVDNAEPIRIGLWSGSRLVTGFWLPGVPQGTKVIYDSVTRSVRAQLADGSIERLHGLVRAYDGISALRWDRLPAGQTMLTIDRTPGDTTPVVIEAMVASVGV